jgi:hypothetical protein
VQLDQLEHEGKPDAAAFDAAPARALDAVEALEEMRQLGRRDAR